MKKLINRNNAYKILSDINAFVGYRLYFINTVNWPPNSLIDLPFREYEIILPIGFKERPCGTLAYNINV